jgi:hypothetical protein
METTIKKNEAGMIVGITHTYAEAEAPVLSAMVKTAKADDYDGIVLWLGGSDSATVTKFSPFHSVLEDKKMEGLEITFSVIKHYVSIKEDGTTKNYYTTGNNLKFKAPLKAKVNTAHIQSLPGREAPIQKREFKKTLTGTASSIISNITLPADLAAAFGSN